MRTPSRTALDARASLASRRGEAGAVHGDVGGVVEESID